MSREEEGGGRNGGVGAMGGTLGASLRESDREASIQPDRYSTYAGITSGTDRTRK